MAIVGVLIIFWGWSYFTNPLRPVVGHTFYILDSKPTSKDDWKDVTDTFTFNKDKTITEKSSDGTDSKSFTWKELKNSKIEVSVIAGAFGSFPIDFKKSTTVDGSKVYQYSDLVGTDEYLVQKK
ncbi:hypothetical protein IV88_GL000801 [Pediococcus argentinicus]|uniref:Lipoprotein n=2 Tax=Pediococcus argentinicus TaxID=480391 RepID=A0A0R2NFS6_9LACO|nr:hypothetical protein IV88_GL000801 [Pediococcus argentinicus]